jgi:hypothetical protein
MKAFRAYLQGLPDEERPAELVDVDLDAFHYGSWLLEHDHGFSEGRERAPLYWDYIRFQRREVTKHFADLCMYVREYAPRRDARCWSGSTRAIARLTWTRSRSTPI